MAGGQRERLIYQWSPTKWTANDAGRGKMMQDTANSTSTGETALKTVAEARGVTREFRVGSVVVHALRGIDLHIKPGEFVALRGRSGSGKTTLLNILIGLDNPSAGQVFILERDLAALGEDARARLRRESIGMMFQNAHLFPSLTAQENVEIPLRLALVEADQREKLAYDALKRVGLANALTIVDWSCQ